MDIKINASIKNGKNILEYFKETEFRTTAFMRGFLIRLTDNYTKQIRGRYKEFKEIEAAIIRENLETVWVDTKKIPKKDKGDLRVETRDLEEHYAATICHAVQRSGNEINKDRTIIEVKPNRRGFKQSPQEVFLLNRYGPWHLDTIPIVPEDNQATIIYKSVTPEKSIAVKKKNKKDKFKVETSLRQIGVKPMSSQDVLKQIKGYDDIEWYALRKEFGIDTRSKRVWKPALTWLTSEGVKKLLTRDITLNKTLYDPNFKDYKNIDKGYKIVGEKSVEGLVNFQDKIRG